MEYLKEFVFEILEQYKNYEEIISCIRSYNSLGKITNKEYDYILKNYNKWVKEFEKNR